MAVKVITARQMRDRFRFVVHLDTTRMDPLNPTQPDPRWLLQREWPLKEGGQRTVYLADLRDQLRAAAIQRIAELQDEETGGTPLPIEGQTF